MERIAVFEPYRPLLFSIAYRMLGSGMDAEDMVQETFLRWQRASGDEVRSPKAYLSAVITRLCIDQLRSARIQRETYFGPWLPEPLLTEHPPGAADTAALAESLSLAFLVLLESLSPVERAVFLLREVFEYDYAEIASIVDKSEANCRQMVKRARERIVERRPRFDVAPEAQARLMQQFALACANGDIEGLLALFADDIAIYSDGGGKAHAALNPVYGPVNAARFLLGVLQKVPPSFTIRLANVNGQSGFIGYVNDRPHIVIGFNLAAGRIRAIYNILNPDKLRSIPAP